MFNNEPLRKAIDPRLDESKQAKRFTEPQSFVANLLRLFQIGLGEAQARDWLRTERVNKQLGRRDDLVRHVAGLVAAVPSNQLRTMSEEVSRQVEDVAQDRQRGLGEGEELSGRLGRIREHHPEAFELLGAGEAADARASYLEGIVFLLDSASRLRDRWPTRLYVVGARGSLTAGEGLSAFLGFFNETWREHDYRLGRTHAHKNLVGILGAQYRREGDGPGGPPPYNELYDCDPDWGELSDVSWENVDPRKRRAFISFLLDQFVRVLRPHPILAVGYWIAKRPLKWLLNRFLG